MKLPVYLDHHATTPVDPRVLDAMLPYFREDFGNAASRQHPFGWKAEAAVEAARQQVAELLGGSAREVVFVSGATEANNLAIFGVAMAYADKGRRHIITQATEHKAVLDPVKVLAGRGWQTTVLPVDGVGRVDPEQVAGAIQPETLLVSVMLANNEIGTVQSISEIGRICRDKNVLFHTDAVQGFGRIPFHVDEMSADLVSVTAHKLYGPKGIGALYVRRRQPRVSLTPLVFGGGQERGIRSGTANVPGIVGLGAACRLAQAEWQAEGERLAELRDRLENRLENALEVVVHGDEKWRLPNNLNVSLVGLDGEALLMGMRDLAVSSGSACSSATLEPSHVLRACGVNDDLARAAIRFGLGRSTTEEEVDFAADCVIEAVARARSLGD